MIENGRGLLLVCTFARFILLQNVSAALIGKLQNTEAVVGSRVEIFCTTSDPYINWEHTPVGSNSIKDVFHGLLIISPYDDRLEVKVNRTTGEYRLIFPSVQKEDAGRYECIDGAGQGERQTAELVVLESAPLCKEVNFDPNGTLIDNDCNLDPELIEFSCSLHYTGNQEPKLRWIQTGGNEVIPRNTVIVRLPGQIMVSVSIKPTLQEDGGSFTCQTSWSNLSWTSLNIKLLYAFNDSSIQKISEPMQLNCAANSSQPCTYHWIHNDELWTEHRAVEISNPGLYTCIARCTIRRHQCVVSAKTVEFVTGDIAHFANQTIGNIVAAALGATIGVIIVVTVAVAVIGIKFLRKRNSKTEIGYSISSSQILITEPPLLQIQGVASDGDNLYIIRRGERSVFVYTLTDPLKLLQEIRNKDLEDLRDIAANKRFLLITDAGHNCVWKITLRLGTRFTKIIENVRDPYTISINSRGEIVMAQNPNKLLIYNFDGSLKHSSNIHGIDGVYHAIQASHDTIAMSVILSSENNKAHGIILVSSRSPDRYSKRKYMGELFGALYQPYHIAVNEDGSIYVADHGEKRILILDKDLKPIKSVSFSSPYIRPTRLQYTSQRLMVGQNNGVVRLLGSTYLQGLEKVSQLAASSEEISINESEESDKLLPNMN